MADRADAGVVRGDDGRRRCAWCLSAEDYVAYHDGEWGRPVADDGRLYEKICLEGFQSGLSWLTILRKREGFRRAFADFVPEVVAGFGPGDVERLVQDAGIVRHRGKIEATIANAAAVLEARRSHGSLARLVWSFEPERKGRSAPRRMGDLQSITPESTALAKALRMLGFRLIGPTTAYATMQSVGVVNDHLAGCHVRTACERERRRVRTEVGLDG
ncbi:MAG TPA: DNA-3-methyladenine glycosylase I [Acidimicrobiales bacterium]|nr:DNA-3-methyladenine glycosylase I [Acidimicrobiales bacterium]